MRVYGDGIKPCPKCKASTTKARGCLHMVCKNPGCNHEYCWSCLRDWSNSHAFFECSSKENLGGTDENFLECERSLRTLSEIDERMIDCFLELQEGLPNDEDRTLCKNFFGMKNIHDMLKCFSIYFCYNAKTEELQLAYTEMVDFVNDNINRFPKGEETSTAPRGPIAVRTEIGNKLMENLYNRFETVSKILKISAKEIPFLMLGLEGAGKMSILLRRFGEVATTFPTSGFKVTTAKFDMFRVTSWDVGGLDQIPPFWTRYFQNTEALIFVVDSHDRDRVVEAKNNLRMILNEKELKDVPLIVFANKQNLPNAMNDDEIIDKLGLRNIPQRNWHVATFGTSGEGLIDGFSWYEDLLGK